jgi:DNA-binding NarL/FixJ family response regulator
MTLGERRSRMSEDQDLITVVLASDSFLIGDGLDSLLSDVPDVEVIGRTRDLDELSTMVDELAPRAVIISIRSQVVTTAATAAATRRLRQVHPNVGIVVISDRTNEFALEILRGGSSGVAFLLDDQLPGIGEVLSALRQLSTGQTILDPSVVDSLIRRGDVVGIDDLTPREVDVLEQMAHGLSNRAIADELHISVKSIEKGITAIFLKLGPFNSAAADRRVSAALVFLRTQTDPFGPVAEPGERSAPVSILKRPETITSLGA